MITLVAYFDGDRLELLFDDSEQCLPKILWERDKNEVKRKSNTLQWLNSMRQERFTIRSGDWKSWVDNYMSNHMEAFL